MQQALQNVRFASAESSVRCFLRLFEMRMCMMTMVL
ncbi:unknown [Sutterella sp. CAG:521]|nr:unknown [Sutterella sp. CAG:521]